MFYVIIQKRKKSSVHHISVQNIPEICQYLQLSISLQRQTEKLKLKMISMKTKNLAKKALVMIAMTFMCVMNADAQQKRIEEFQMLMVKNDTTYKNCLK